MILKIFAALMVNGFLLATCTQAADLPRIERSVHRYDISQAMASNGKVVVAGITAVATTGYAVSFTAVTLIAGVVMWIFMSDLRFQSDAAILLSFMLIVNPIAAVLIVPSWCVVFKPKFVTAVHYDEDGVLEND